MPSSHFTDKIDLPMLLELLNKTAATGYLTPLRVVQEISDIDEKEWLQLAQEAEHVLKRLCERPVLTLHNHYEGVCPQCRQCHIFTPEYYQEVKAQPDYIFTCHHGCQTPITTWRWHSVFRMVAYDDLESASPQDSPQFVEKRDEIRNELQQQQALCAELTEQILDEENQPGTHFTSSQFDEATDRRLLLEGRIQALKWVLGERETMD